MTKKVASILVKSSLPPAEHFWLRAWL